MEFSDNVFRVVMDNYMNDDGDTHIAHHDLVFGELAERREKNRQTIVKKKLVLREKQKKKHERFYPSDRVINNAFLY
jgi:hypothetical protein